MRTTAEEISSWMAQGDDGGQIQLVQTRFKRELALAWQIPPGARVLEIGCGQGDMTAVLAAAVGPGGHVTAVDLAGPDAGAPISLGDATRHLLASPVGGRLRFRLGCDVLDPALELDGPFDLVVLAHASWYFATVEQLQAVLRLARAWAGRLCFSEWDLAPASMDQVPHMLAALIQGQLEAFKHESRANVRTPLARGVLLELLRASGWAVRREVSLEAPRLQDGGWEVAHCLREVSRELPLVPPRLRPLLASQLALLERLAAAGAPAALPSYAIVAGPLDNAST